MKSPTREPPAANRRSSGKPAQRLGAIKRALNRQIEQMPPKKLKPYENNPMTHPPEQIDEIKASIAEFGFTVPILVDENDMILAGHGRQLAALEMGLKSVPVIRRAGLSEDQKRAYVLADNKIARNAEFDWQLVAGELTALRDAGFNLDLTGFRDFESSLLLAADWTPPEISDDELTPDTFSIHITLEQKKIIDQAHTLRQSMRKVELSVAEAVTEICREYMNH